MRGFFPPLYRTVEKAHGRIEIREIRAAPVHSKILFPGAKQVIEVTRIREIKTQRSVETILYITSLSSRIASKEKLLEIIRGHWEIENKVHYVKDVTFNEDRRRYTVNPGFISAFRSFIISVIRLMGFDTIPRAQRMLSMNFYLMLKALGIN